MEAAAIVPAAGAGRRFGGRVPKPFVPLRGAPLLLQALRACQGHRAIGWIIVVVGAGELARVGALVKRHRITKALPPCVGGASRAESVLRGFAAVPEQAKWILVHDGARPCVTDRLIGRAIRAAHRHGAVACGLPSSLTIKAVDDRRRVRVTLDREQLWGMQTPQVFSRAWFAQAVSRLDGGRLAHVPDDAALLELAGLPVQVIPGDPLNIKVTRREDLMLAEAILKDRVRNGRIDAGRDRL